MTQRFDFIAAGFFTLAIPALIFALSLGKVGERTIGTLENIHGIPYPTQDGSIIVLEDMAHVDLFLTESVFAKQAKLTIAFDPKDATSINLGIRDNEFWLSYIKYPLYVKGVDAPGFQTKEIPIALTTAIQDTNRSVDFMFFTQGPVRWRISALRASVESDMPSLQETKSYVKSVLTRERAL